MTIPDADPARAAFESFLVEDVILTLGNLRGTLGWLCESPDKARAGIDRLDGQIGLLEDRARCMARHLREDGPAESTNLFTADARPGATESPDAEDGDLFARSILSLLADAPVGIAEPAPIFRSRRA